MCGFVPAAASCWSVCVFICFNYVYYTGILFQYLIALKFMYVCVETPIQRLFIVKSTLVFLDVINADQVLVQILCRIHGYVSITCSLQLILCISIAGKKKIENPSWSTDRFVVVLNSKTRISIEIWNERHSWANNLID